MISILGDADILVTINLGVTSKCVITHSNHTIYFPSWARTLLCCAALYLAILLSHCRHSEYTLFPFTEFFHFGHLLHFFVESRSSSFSADGKVHTATTNPVKRGIVCMHENVVKIPCRVVPFYGTLHCGQLYTPFLFQNQTVIPMSSLVTMESVNL